MSKKNFKQYNKKQKNSDILAVNVEMSGFPILIGDQKFFFSTSEENMTKFYEFKENPQKYMDKIDELSKNSDELAKKVNKDKYEPTLEEYLGTIEDNKKALKIIYELMLGEGSFNKLYERYPDIRALANICETTINTISAGIDRYNAKELIKQKKQAAKNAEQKKANKKRV